MPESRIVGGHKATKRYAYQASIDSPAAYINEFVYMWRHFCGGAIITNRHILTAAHCVVNVANGVERETNALSILVGTNDFNKGGTRYSVCATKYHEQYLTHRWNYDIAIITVKSYITLTPGQIETISWSTNYTESGVRCVITGWGSETDYIGEPTRNLKELEVTTMTDEDCQAAFASMDEHNICTQSDGEGEGACGGDSGGPVVDIEMGILVGVINSGNEGVCGTGRADFNARVSAFDDWIMENTDNEGAECKSETSAFNTFKKIIPTLIPK